MEAQMSAWELQALINLLAEARDHLPITPDTKEWHEDAAKAIESLRGKLKKEAA